MPESRLERRLRSHLRLACIDQPKREYRFAKPHFWSFDFAWLRLKIAVECEGHPSHQTTRFHSDMLKYNEAQLRGWIVLRFTSEMIGDGSAIEAIQRAIRMRGAEYTAPPKQFNMRDSDSRSNEERTIQMPTATATRPYAPCPEGEDILFVLKIVEEVINPPDAMFNPGEKRWKWVFETVELFDPETEDPYRLPYFTGTAYGHEKAGLTKLLDRIARNLTPEERANFNTDTVTGKKFKLDVIHKTLPDGTIRAQVDSIKRVTAPANSGAKALAGKRSAPPVEDDELEGETDPFSDE